MLEPLLLFWKKKPDEEMKRLKASLGFKMGDTILTVPAEKDGTLKDETLALVLHGFVQGLALRLREYDVHLLSAGMRESVLYPGNICLVLVVDVYTRRKNDVVVWRPAVLVELSKKRDWEMYVFSVAGISIMRGFATPLDIFPEYSFVYIDMDYFDAVRRGLKGQGVRQNE